MRRALLVVVWLTAAGGTGGLAFALYELKRTRPVHAAPPAVDRLPARQRHNSLGALDGHRTSVGAPRPHRAGRNGVPAKRWRSRSSSPIRVKDKYAEVLIYFHRPGRPDTLPPRRVQWTPTNGYVETVVPSRRRLCVAGVICAATSASAGFRVPTAGARLRATGSGSVGRTTPNIAS